MIGSLSAKEISIMLGRSQVFKSPLFLAHYVRGSEFKVGFSIRRSFGSAVERNRFKRVVRSRLKKNNMTSLCVLIKVISKINLSDQLYTDLNLFCSHMTKTNN